MMSSIMIYESFSFGGLQRCTQVSCGDVYCALHALHRRCVFAIVLRSLPLPHPELPRSQKIAFGMALSSISSNIGVCIRIHEVRLYADGIGIHAASLRYTDTCIHMYEYISIAVFY